MQRKWSLKWKIKPFLTKIKKVKLKQFWPIEESYLLGIFLGMN